MCRYRLVRIVHVDNPDTLNICHWNGTPHHKVGCGLGGDPCSGFGSNLAEFGRVGRVIGLSCLHSLGDGIGGRGPSGRSGHPGQRRRARQPHCLEGMPGNVGPASSEVAKPGIPKLSWLPKTCPRGGQRTPEPTSRPDGCSGQRQGLCQGLVKGLSRACQGLVKGLSRACQRLCQGLVKGLSGALSRAEAVLLGTGLFFSLRTALKDRPGGPCSTGPTQSIFVPVFGDPRQRTGRVADPPWAEAAAADGRGMWDGPPGNKGLRQATKPHRTIRRSSGGEQSCPHVVLWASPQRISGPSVYFHTGARGSECGAKTPQNLMPFQASFWGRTPVVQAGRSPIPSVFPS